MENNVKLKKKKKLKVYSFEEIMSKGLNKNLEIKDKFYCKDCGLLLVDESTALQIEYFYYSLSEEKNCRPIYVDICECNNS